MRVRVRLAAVVSTITVGLCSCSAEIESNASDVKPPPAVGKSLPSQPAVPIKRLSLPSTPKTVPVVAKGDDDHAENQKTGNDRIFLGYYPSWSQMTPEQIPYRHFTHICHAFFRANGNSDGNRKRLIPNRALTRSAHRHGVKVLLSLGGGGSREMFESMTKSSDEQQEYVRAVIDAVRKYDYDGVDLDWEYPNDPETSRGFARLARQLRRELDEIGKKRSKHYVLIAAVGGSDWTGRWLKPEVLLETMDFLNVMTYDFAGPWSQYAAHHAPLFPAADDPGKAWRGVTRAMHYWHRKKQIPKHRLIVGIALYGRGFQQVRPFEKLANKKKGPYSAVSYRDLRVLIDKGWKRSWNEECQVPWISTPEGSTIIGYDDEESVREKVTWAKRQTYGGIFFWSIDQDRLTDNSHPLIESASQAFRRH